MTEEKANDRLSGSDILRTAGGSDVGGEEQASLVLQPQCSANIVVPNTSVTIFDHRVEKITSSILVIVMFALNWFSVYQGHAPYCPEWAIGIALYGFSADWYRYLKTRALGNKGNQNEQVP